MNAYYVSARQVDSKFVWSVIETSSRFIIRDFDFEEEAIEYATFLSSGGAFDGATPAFILSKLSRVRLESIFSFEAA